MKVYCVKCSTLMVQHEDYFNCLRCNGQIRLDWDGLCPE